MSFANQLISGHFPQSARFHSISCLDTKRVGTGSLCEARPSASRATASVTPFISYRILPGLTTAIQPFRGTLAFSHSSFGGLLREGFVREDSNPDFASTLYVPRNGDPGGLDLPGRDIAGLKGLEPEIAETDLASAVCSAPHAALLHFSEFDSFWS